MPSNWTKQNQQISAAGQRAFNGGAGDEIVGGRLTGVPSGLNISQGIQDIPGDRLVLGMADALVLSDTDIGTLYGGMYQYMTTYDLSTATPTINRGLFWRIASADNNYITTPDESGAMGADYWAGVAINTLTKGYSWWMQIAGKVKVKFRAVMTGAGAAGCAVYYAAAGAGADVGTFDIFAGSANNPTFDDVQHMQNLYAGQAETAPANDTASVIDMDLKRVRF